MYWGNEKLKAKKLHLKASVVSPAKNHIHLRSSGNEENKKDPRAKKKGDLTKARFPAGMNEDGIPFTEKDNTERRKG